MSTPGRHRRSSVRRAVLGLSATALVGTGVGVPLAVSGMASASSDAATAARVVRITEQWDRDVDQRALGGAYAASATAGDSFIIRFSGTGVRLDGLRAIDGGLADVYLDGVKQAPVSFYADRQQWHVPVWTRDGLADRGHSLQLVVRGAHENGSRGDWVYVDAVQTVGHGTYQENAPNVQMNWSPHASSQAAGNRYAAESHVAQGDSGPAPRTDITFTGTGITVLACESPASGLANVYLDGRAAGQVDLYRGFSSCGDKVYTSPDLPAGRHVLRLEVPGFHDATSTGTTVGLDAVVVR